MDVFDVFWATGDGFIATVLKSYRGPRQARLDGRQRSLSLPRMERIKAGQGLVGVLVVEVCAWIAGHRTLEGKGKPVRAPSEFPLILVVPLQTGLHRPHIPDGHRALAGISIRGDIFRQEFRDRLIQACEILFLPCNTDERRSDAFRDRADAVQVGGVSLYVEYVTHS
jgi:hypothetical protein